MSNPAVSKPLYAVHAEAVPVMITAHRLGDRNYRIRFARGIGWAPKRYTSEADVLAALLAVQSYTVADARMAKAVCTQLP